MKALDFIKMYSEKHPGAILGSYALHQLQGRGFNDIDFFTPLLKVCLEENESRYVSQKITVKEIVDIMGYTFHIKGKNYPAEFNFVAYECKDFDDVPVNLVMIASENPPKFRWNEVESLMMGFDLDILRVGMSLHKGSEEVDIKTKWYEDCIKTKRILNIVREKRFSSWHDETRIEKYKERFPDYEFIKVTEQVL